MSNFPVPLSGTTNTLLWANEWEIEPQALDQIRNVSNLAPVRYVRVMPDVHMGEGASIGTVIGMDGAIAPSAVGVDIGCGVSAVRTGLWFQDIKHIKLSAIREAVESVIPVGFSSHDRSVPPSLVGLERSYNRLWGGWKNLNARFKDQNLMEGRARQQLGTLGGGNHFIELCVDEFDEIWLTLHSGSRNVGKEIAEYHTRVAKTLPHNKGLGSLAYLIEGTLEFQNYMDDLYWAQEYAYMNRATMMGLFKNIIKEFFAKAHFDEAISCHHNYVEVEEIQGQQLLVTRKGAISAHKGEPGVIPGNMSVGSFIVFGLGNEQSLYSAAHGAGRLMSRGKAKSLFGLPDLLEQTRLIESRKDIGIVDEIPAAYKDFSKVMDAQKDLVAIGPHLQTLMCVKG